MKNSEKKYIYIDSLSISEKNSNSYIKILRKIFTGDVLLYLHSCVRNYNIDAILLLVYV